MYNTPNNYFFTEVMTAPPQKLHLMLIDGIIRDSQRAKQFFQNNEEREGRKSLLHARNILANILAKIDYEDKSEYVVNAAGVYLFIYNTLTKASIDQNESKIDEALRVLAVERETWKKVCEDLSAANDDQSFTQSAEQMPAPHMGHAPLPQADDTNYALPGESFSLEA